MQRAAHAEALLPHCVLDRLSNRLMGTASAAQFCMTGMRVASVARFLAALRTAAR
jgi:hypothetical protein